MGDAFVVVEPLRPPRLSIIAGSPSTYHPGRSWRNPRAREPGYKNRCAQQKCWRQTVSASDLILLSTLEFGDHRNVRSQQRVPIDASRAGV